MANPLVSVIIPCHNAADWVADAIQSALAQTYSPVEIVVVDDGSTDGSREIIRSFEGRIRYEFLNHCSAPKTRNRGLELASAEFIQFLDADDILFPHCVTRKIDAILREGADIVYSGGFFFSVQANQGNYESQAPPKPDHAEAVAHIIASTIVTTLLMCRRACLEKVKGFDEQLVKGQEHDLLFRLAVEGFKLAYVPEALSLNRTGHNSHSITSLTSQHPLHLERLFDRFEKMLENTPLWTREVRAALAWRFHLTGVKYLSAQNRRKAVMMFQHAVTLDRRYMSYLPFSRRLTVPLVGAYFAEAFLIHLRRLLPRFS
ncbi:MAG: glycosyltransferase family A protein [Thermodesulfobacteriota bacterium]|jgi:glycosyltransferase involved in cell wall biosynthesis